MSSHGRRGTQFFALSVKGTKPLPRVLTLKSQSQSHFSSHYYYKGDKVGTQDTGRDIPASLQVMEVVAKSYLFPQTGLPLGHAGSEGSHSLMQNTCHRPHQGGVLKIVTLWSSGSQPVGYDPITTF